MRYLRMLSNSMAAAALATSYVIALVLHLNPNLPLHPSRLAPLIATVGLYYVVHLTVIAYILLVVRQLLARELFSPAWLSVNVLTWLGAMAAAAGAVLMWRNLVAFSLVLDAAVCVDGAAVQRAGARGDGGCSACCWPPAAAPRRRRAVSGHRCSWPSSWRRSRRCSACAAAACRRRSRRGGSTRSFDSRQARGVRPRQRDCDSTPRRSI